MEEATGGRRKLHDEGPLHILVFCIVHQLFIIIIRMIK
jgi:hypothetical protein